MDAVRRVAHRLGAAGLLAVMSIYRRSVEVMKPQSARVDPEFWVKERLVRNSVTDSRGAIRSSVVAVGFVAEVEKAGGVKRGKDKGLLGED